LSVELRDRLQPFLFALSNVGNDDFRAFAGEYVDHAPSYSPCTDSG
jgi:hypothetical protein